MLKWNLLQTVEGGPDVVESAEEVVEVVIESVAGVVVVSVDLVAAVFPFIFPLKGFIVDMSIFCFSLLLFELSWHRWIFNNVANKIRKNANFKFSMIDAFIANESHWAVAGKFILKFHN